MTYVALADDGKIYNLCDCGDFDSAEEAEQKLGINAVWIADEPTWKLWLESLKQADEYRIKMQYGYLQEKGLTID